MTLGNSLARLTSILNTLRGTTYTAPANVYVQLHTADPGSAGTTSVSAGSTTRNVITWNAPSGSNPTTMTLNTLGAWTNGGSSETISHVSIWDASTVGNFLGSFALTASQAWVSTNTLTLTSFTVSATPTAA